MKTTLRTTTLFLLRPIVCLIPALLLCTVPATLAQVRSTQEAPEIVREPLVQSEIIQDQTRRDSSPVDEKSYVGNVYGNVVDAETGKPVAGAEVVLTEAAVARSKKPFDRGIATDGGYVALPRELDSSALRTITDENGDFLINSVPTPYPAKSYTIVVQRSGYFSQVLNQIPVRPGAVMSLHLNIALDRGFGRIKIFEKDDDSAPFKYHDEEFTDLSRFKLDRATTSSAAGESRTIFATREGLVGRTTANGHVITNHDHFVALPSRLFLSSNFGYQFQVKLTYRGRSVLAPVWDLGPHNGSDDYWNPSTIRAMWRDLSQGLPEAQAAYQNRYNNGKDDRGRVVPNPAGIDLADGTFWDDLRMTNNDSITVEYQWTSGHADFSVSTSTVAVWIARGTSASFPVTVQSIDGFNSPVTLSVSGLPAGASAASKTVQPVNGSATTTLSVSTSSSTPTGAFSLTFTGTCGTLTRRTSVTLNINPPPGAITVNAKLNGSSWVGPVSYYVTGPSILFGSSVPGTTNGMVSGRYTIGSISGAPGALSSVSPSATQTLSPGGTITFTLNFVLTPPAAPSNLSGNAISSTKVALSWNDNSSNETEFRIERKKTASGSWSQIASLGSNVRTYTNSGLSSNTTYFYRVRAANQAGTSGYSNERSVTTPR